MTFDRSGPTPPYLLEAAILLFSIPCLALSITYATQISRAPAVSDPPVSWTQAGSGTLYYIPPSLTFLLALTNNILYRRISMPILCSLLYGFTLFAGWAVTLTFWAQCHFDIWDRDCPYCYQRSLYFGDGKQMYQGVNERIAAAIIALGGFIFVFSIIYTVVAGVDLVKNRNKRRYGRDAGSGRGRYASGAAVGGFIFTGAFAGGDGGGWGGGDGGAGGDGGGGGGGDGGGGGC